MTFVADIAPRSHDSRAPYIGTNSVTAGSLPMGDMRRPENDLSRLVLQPVLDRLAALRGFQSNWNGRGGQAASRHLLSHAEYLIGNYYQASASTGFGWSNPVLNLDEDGGLVLEWWRGLKKFTLYLAPAEKPRFVRVWGDDIDTEMDDGTLAEVDDFAELWVFLNS